MGKQADGIQDTGLVASRYAALRLLSDWGLPQRIEKVHAHSPISVALYSFAY